MPFYVIIKKPWFHGFKRLGASWLQRVGVSESSLLRRWTWPTRSAKMEVSLDFAAKSGLFERRDTVVVYVPKSIYLRYVDIGYDMKWTWFHGFKAIPCHVIDVSFLVLWEAEHFTNNLH